MHHRTGIAVDENDAYVVDELFSLRVFDASDPTSPSLVDTYPLPGDGHGIAVSNGNVFVAEESGGLYVLRYLGPNVTQVFLPVVVSTAAP